MWLLFVFDRNRGGTKSKVSPPRLDGVKTGLFATRTPHRPNNLGLSLVREAVGRMGGRVAAGRSAEGGLDVTLLLMSNPRSPRARGTD